MENSQPFAAVSATLPPKPKHFSVLTKTHLANFSSHSSNFINPLGLTLNSTSPVLGLKRNDEAPTRSAVSLAISMSWAGALSSVKLILQAKNFPVNEALRNYVELKIGKAVRNYSSLVREVDVRLSVRESGKGPKRRCAVTLYTKRHGVVRAEGDAESTYGSIDLVSLIVKRNLGRIKEKETDHGRHMKGVNRLKMKDMLPEIASLETEEDLVQKILRAKHIDVPPLTVTEAIEQVDMVDRNFYAFRNEETGEINILYRRQDGGYGLIVRKADGTAEKLEPGEPSAGAEN